MKQAFPLQSWAESDGVDGMDGWIATVTATASLANVEGRGLRARARARWSNDEV
jgi:hypothetical protein